MSCEKILLIGIDGADYVLLKKFIENKYLPNMEKVCNEGTFIQLNSTIPPLSPPAWTSIFTGEKPDKHGIHGFLIQKKNSYFYKVISSEDWRVKPIWAKMSERGLRCVLVNIPFTYPPTMLNGILITGLGTPSKKSKFVYPPELKRKILVKYPFYNVDFNEELLNREAKTIYDWEDRIIRIERAQVKLFIELLEKDNWDFGAIVLRSIDVIQHFAFNDIMFLLKHYRRIDKIIGKLLKKFVNEKTRVIICSDHGFRRIDKQFFVDNWLESEGYLKFKGSKKSLLLRLGIDAERVRGFLLKMRLRYLVEKIQRSALAEKIIKIIPSSSHQYIFEIDWKKTKAFSYKASGGLIKLNLKGREPEGCVPKFEKNKILNELKQKLSQVCDTENGRYVFKKIYTKEELGMFEEDMPELLLLPNEGYEIGDYNMSGTIFKKHPNRTGDHDIDGILLTNFDVGKKNIYVWDIGKMILSMIQD